MLGRLLKLKLFGESKTSEKLGIFVVQEKRGKEKDTVDIKARKVIYRPWKLSDVLVFLLCHRRCILQAFGSIKVVLKGQHLGTFGFSTCGLVGRKDKALSPAPLAG